jgi:hypothetical protein
LAAIPDRYFQQICGPGNLSRGKRETALGFTAQVAFTALGICSVPLCMATMNHPPGTADSPKQLP